MSPAPVLSGSFNMVRLKSGLACILMLFALYSLAEPAPWYKWRSKIDQRETCSQTSPGHGWEQSAGPYRDARCEKIKKIVKPG
jgi:hypothetical protein